MPCPSQPGGCSCSRSFRWPRRRGRGSRGRYPRAPPYRRPHPRASRRWPESAARARRRSLPRPRCRRSAGRGPRRPHRPRRPRSWCRRCRRRARFGSWSRVLERGAGRRLAVAEAECIPVQPEEGAGSRVETRPRARRASGSRLARPATSSRMRRARRMSPRPRVSPSRTDPSVSASIGWARERASRVATWQEGIEAVCRLVQREMAVLPEPEDAESMGPAASSAAAILRHSAAGSGASPRKPIQRASGTARGPRRVLCR